MIEVPVSLYESRVLAHNFPWSRIEQAENTFIAGGAVRDFVMNRKATDVDIFCANRAAFEAQKSILWDTGYVGSRGNKDFTEFKRGDRIVQVIGFRWFQTIEEVIDSFDFTVSQFGLKDGKIVATEQALVDAMAMRLVVHKVTYPVSTLRRLNKYIQKGFVACNGTYKQLVEGCRLAEEVNLNVEYVD